jgi:hypothetical protein
MRLISFMSTSFGIDGHTFDRIMRCEGVIRRLMFTSYSLIWTDLYCAIKLSTSSTLSRYMQIRLFDIRDAKMMCFAPTMFAIGLT